MNVIHKQTACSCVNLYVKQFTPTSVSLWFGGKSTPSYQIAEATDLRQIAKYLTKLADKLDGVKQHVPKVDPDATVQLFDEGGINVTVNGDGTDTPKLLLKGYGSAYDFYITADKMKQLGEALVKHSKGLKAALRG